MEKTLKRILKTHSEDKGNIIAILQDVQENFGYIPENAVNLISKKLNIPSSRIFGIITFYSLFHLKPQGENVITICRGTACHVKGSERLLNRILIELDIPHGENTTNDLKFTVEKVNCVGACGIAPVTIFNKEVHGKMTLDRMMKEIKKLKEKESEQ
ncbi:MAG: NAD(P)H-dependent oxidoreductase subunit E [Nitrospirota bacterium]